jgi:hypothetical protein
MFGGGAPRFLRDEVRDSSEGAMQYCPPWARCRQVNADHRLHLDDVRGDFDEAKAQRVELRDAPRRTLGHRYPQAPHDPVGAGVQEQPQLAGAGLRARCSIGRQMCLPGFDVVLGLAAPAIAIFIKHAGVALFQIGDDEARVGPPAPASTRAMILSTLLQLAAPS